MLLLSRPSCHKYLYDGLIIARLPQVGNLESHFLAACLSPNVERSRRRGYFRLLPYPLIREAIRAINRQGQPAVFYLHPYELDAEEPFGSPSTRLRTTLRHPLPGETCETRLARLSQGLGRGRVEAKLRRLWIRQAHHRLADFEWGSVREWMNRTRNNTE